MKSGQHGRGTIKEVRNAEGAVVGYRALLPRSLSTPPPDCKNPDLYQESVGEQMATRTEARELLDGAILMLRDNKSALRHGLPLSHYIESEIRARLQDARRTYPTAARASRAVSTWRSIDKNWLQRAPFYDWQPTVIGAAELQAYVNWMVNEDGASGEPLSGHFVRNAVGLLRHAIDRAGIKPNPARDLDLPPKGSPRVVHMDLLAQRRFFGADAVPLEDRVIVGCGMGAGLRIGELLAIEAADVQLSENDPHLFVQYGGPDRSPTKGRELRRVELFEPGLGFWKLFMRQLYRAEHRRVFAGPEDGYRKHWPEQFQGWAEVAGLDRFTSHAMRHTYAVAMLSGTWGYEPRTLEFVSKQLGHADVQTTERYYAKFEAETWRREVRHMTGRTVGRASRKVITAAELLGTEADSEAGESSSQGNSPENGEGEVDPRHSPRNTHNGLNPAEIEAFRPQSAKALAIAALGALARGDEGGRVPGRELARRILDLPWVRAALAIAAGADHADDRIVELAQLTLSDESGWLSATTPPDRAGGAK